MVRNRARQAYADDLQPGRGRRGRQSFDPLSIGEQQPAASSVRLLGRVLFTDYMFAFEVTSILIIAAMVGAVVLAGRKGN